MVGWRVLETGMDTSSQKAGLLEIQLGFERGTEWGTQLLARPSV